MRTEVYAFTVQGGAVHYLGVLAKTEDINVEEALQTLEKLEKSEHLYTIDWSAIDVATNDANHRFGKPEHLEPTHQVWHRLTEAALDCMHLHDGLQETPDFLEDAQEAPEIIFQRFDAGRPRRRPQDTRRPRRRPEGDRFSVRPLHVSELREQLASTFEDLEPPQLRYVGHLDLEAAYDEAAIERDVGPEHLRSSELTCYVREMQIAFACASTIQHRLNSPMLNTTR